MRAGSSHRCAVRVVLGSDPVEVVGRVAARSADIA
jgi:hypothetical protein